MSTGISYLDQAWNPVTGCRGKGCKAHCWARDMVKRFPAMHGESLTEGVYGGIEVDPHPFEVVRFHPDRLDKPLRWRKPRRIGVCFMGDWMDDQVSPNWIFEMMKVVEQCPQHQFLTLTKQPQNLVMRKLALRDLPNLWFGVSITDQEDADRMISDLLRVPGKRWISLEPLLGPVDLWDGGFGPLNLVDEISWVVVGAESGPRRRPCKLEWVQSVVEQCDAAQVPVYIKQLDLGGKVSHNPEDWPAWARRREMP